MSQQINLYNPLFLSREKHFSAATILWCLLSLCFVLAAYCGYVTYALHAPEDRAKYYERQVGYKRSEMADTVARYSPEGRNKQLESEVRSLEAQLVSRQEIWRSLNSLELGTGGGFGDFLEAFSIRSVPGVWLTGFSIGGAGGELTLQGRVLRPELVSVFLASLGKAQVMSGRKVTELKLHAADEAQSVSPAGTAAAVAPRFVEFSLSAPATFPASGAVAGVPLPAPSGGPR